MNRTSKFQTVADLSEFSDLLYLLYRHLLYSLALCKKKSFVTRSADHFHTECAIALKLRARCPARRGELYITCINPKLAQTRLTQIRPLTIAAMHAYHANDNFGFDPE